MHRVVEVIGGGARGGPITDKVVLDYDGRHRRRIAIETNGGMKILLDFAAVPDLKDGDALVLDDGRLLAVEAAPEPLMEITCADARHLARLAWHIGNRHLPAEIGATALRIRADHVIADMAKGLGATVRSLMAPFEPERGAYHADAKGAGAHRHHGHHHHDHEH